MSIQYPNAQNLWWDSSRPYTDYTILILVQKWPLWSRPCSLHTLRRWPWRSLGLYLSVHHLGKVLSRNFQMIKSQSGSAPSCWNVPCYNIRMLKKQVLLMVLSVKKSAMTLSYAIGHQIFTLALTPWCSIMAWELSGPTRQLCLFTYPLTWNVAS